METLLIAVGSGLAFVLAYCTYGRWLGRRVFELATGAKTPACRMEDGTDYVPTHKSIVFGHHFTSIAGTGPIVGPAIAVMWGWLPALLWVVFGSIFIGAVHDFGSLVVSLRNNGQTVGDIAGRLLNRRVRVLFLLVLFLALTIIIAIFGLVIAAVFQQYPAAIFPVWVQVPIAIGIGLWLHKRGVGLFWPSVVALSLMYLSVVFGDQNTRVGIAFFDDTIGGALHAFNTWAAGLPIIVWVAVLLVYAYIASVIPVWVLLQPRDYINSLQLASAVGLVVVGLVVAAFIGGAPPVEGAERVPLEIAAPAWNFDPAGAPLLFPFLFITVACGAISGFHCLVSSGTSSKQLRTEPDARFVGFGAMLTEGFLAVVVILACVAGLGLGLVVQNPNFHASFSGIEYVRGDGQERSMSIGWGPGNTSEAYSYVELPGSPAGTLFPDVDYYDEVSVEHPELGPVFFPTEQVWVDHSTEFASLVGRTAWHTRYTSWSAAGGLARTVGAFVDGGANFLKAIGVPGGVAVALLGVLVASFAGTTLDTATRLQRYVVQELAATFSPRVSKTACPACGYDLSFNVSGACPECGRDLASSEPARQHGSAWNPLVWLTNKHGATLFAVVLALLMAAWPVGMTAADPSLFDAIGDGSMWGWITTYTGKGGLLLWPMFGATNQLIGGLAFLVIAFYLLRRRKPVWFLVLPLVFMLVMPAWAMVYSMFIQAPGAETSWLEDRNWLLLAIGGATVVLEAWMVVEAALLWPRVKGLLEDQLPGSADPLAVAVAAE